MHQFCEARNSGPQLGMVFLRGASPRGKPTLVRRASRHGGRERARNLPARNASWAGLSLQSSERGSQPRGRDGPLRRGMANNSSEFAGRACESICSGRRLFFDGHKVEARKYGDLGDIEQNGTDLLVGLDYTHLTAMMAPRPTLLIYDAEDDCCFRAPL